MIDHDIHRFVRDREFDMGVARGCTASHGGENKMLQMHPQVEEEVKFVRTVLLGGESWRVGVLNLVSVACVLRWSTFFKEKNCTPEKILVTPMPTADFVLTPLEM